MDYDQVWLGAIQTLATSVYFTNFKEHPIRSKRWGVPQFYNSNDLKEELKNASLSLFWVTLPEKSNSIWAGNDCEMTPLPFCIDLC